MNKAVTEHYKTKGLDLSASIGIALVNDEEIDVSEIYKGADLALYDS